MKQLTLLLLTYLLYYHNPTFRHCYTSGVIASDLAAKPILYFLFLEDKKFYNAQIWSSFFSIDTEQTSHAFIYANIGSHAFDSPSFSFNHVGSETCETYL